MIRIKIERREDCPKLGWTELIKDIGFSILISVPMIILIFFILLLIGPCL